MFDRFCQLCVLDGVRTPLVDSAGAFADANPFDLGIKAAKAVFARPGTGARCETHEAQGAQPMAVAREPGLGEDGLNVEGGASAGVGGGQGIALPLQNTGAA